MGCVYDNTMEEEDHTQHQIPQLLMLLVTH